MYIKALFKLFILLPVSFAVVAESKSENIEGYQLSYVEREPGVDDYEITMLVSDRYIRIDEEGENSGFIVYDDKDKVIYSVSNVEKSVLVINQHKFSETDAPVKTEVEYLQLADAPTVSGKKIYNYRAYVLEGKDEITCAEVQLVESLLPEVRMLLRNYQTVVAGQQVKMTDNTVSEIQTACYFVDQIYNTGEYYEKGLPIQEWHSNERSKILTSYKEVPIAKDKFIIPEEYNQFSMDSNSKTFIN